MNSNCILTHLQPPPPPLTAQIPDNPDPMMISPMVSLVIRKVTTGIIAPHGAIDFFHAIDRKKIENYIVTNIGASVTTQVLWSVQKDLVLVILIALSVLHFRHQTFDPAPLLRKNANWVKAIKLLASSLILIASSVLTPPITYACIALFHTPHQYNTNKHLFTKKGQYSYLSLPH